MEEILQCPRCVDLAAAAGTAILATDFPLIMNGETTDWTCQKGHTIKAAEIEAIMTELATPAEPAKPLTAAEKRAAKRAANAHAREESTPPAEAQNEGETGGVEVPVSGNDVEMTPSSGNVFADLGLPDAEALDRKAREAVALGPVTAKDGPLSDADGLDSLNRGVRLPDGDVLVGIVIREAYVESALGLAEENGQTIATWAQDRLDYYMESEFSTVKTV